MPKYRARVECFSLPPADSMGVGAPGQTSRIFGETFVNIVQHLSSSTDLGIEMIAANYGIGGTGFQFWDQPNPPGSRAWACFRFHSASFGKFDCLVFEMTGTVSTAYGSPIVCSDGGTTNGNQSGARQLLISFSCHPSGSNTTLTDGPWNGTYSLTSASIGNPVWKLNSVGKGAFFPRQNGFGGTYSGSRGAMAPVHGFDTNYTFGAGRKLHIIASEDSLTLLHDKNCGDSYEVLHFGSFTPRSGVFCDAPYFFMKGPASSTQPISLYSSVYGTVGTVTVTSAEGCATHPNLVSGSHNFSYGFIAGTETVTNGFNRFINSGTFEKISPFIVINDNTYNVQGLIGTANHISTGIGMPNRAVSSLSSSVAIGNTVINSRKLILPWSGTAPSVTPVLQQSGTNWSLDL